jgi:hypothetical protein
MNYTRIEYCDMHLMYGLAEQNANEAKRLYQQKFPNRRVPDAKTFRSVNIRLRETGYLLPNKSNTGRHRDNDHEEDILHRLE